MSHTWLHSGARTKGQHRKNPHSAGTPALLSQLSTRELRINSVGARLIFLPPYSPDLNPIEQVFAKLKAALRKAQARSIEAVVQEIARTLPSFSSGECANYFRHAGYASI